MVPRKWAQKPVQVGWNNSTYSFFWVYHNLSETHIFIFGQFIRARATHNSMSRRSAWNVPPTLFLAAHQGHWNAFQTSGGWGHPVGKVDFTNGKKVGFPSGGGIRIPGTKVVACCLQHDHFYRWNRCEMMGRFLTSWFFPFFTTSVLEVFHRCLWKLSFLLLNLLRSTRKSSNLQAVEEFIIHMILGFSLITDQMTNHNKRWFVMEHLGHVCSTHASTNTTKICLFVTGQTADPCPTVCWSISPPRSGSGEETRRRRAGDG